MVRARRRTLLLVCLLPLLLLALAWVDVLPGGWRLRGWVTPHPVREAREQAERSARRLLAFEAENAEAPAGATVWLGSSTIERFPLAELMPNTTHLNRGIGGESAGQLLDRLERSLPAARPARLVFYIGSIDHRVHDRSAARVAADARRVVEAALERYGEDPPAVTVIGILPEQDMPSAMVERLARTNAALAALCTAHGWRFVDTARAPLRQEDGSLDPAYAADHLHLNRDGYKVLALWLGP